MRGDGAMTLGSHQRTIGKSQAWITPKWIIDALGPFDLDPCAADPRPWNCAETNLTTVGLGIEWWGAVWLNPPFHRYQVAEWVGKLAIHGSGIALLHARTEAKWFEPCWMAGAAILFLADRIHFHYPDGTRAAANSGAPACLVAFGKICGRRLEHCKIPGALLTQWSFRVAMGP